MTAAADQHSVQSMTRSSNPHGTPALPGLVGVAVGPETLARAPSPTISLHETDPATPAERVLLACFPLATTGRWATSAGPTSEQRSGRSRACRVGQGCLVGSTPGPSGLFGGGSRTAA